MAEDSYTARPPRVTITNLENGDFISAQFNPTEVKEKLGPAYNDLAVLGLSHRPQQYTGMENLQISFELVLDALSAEGGADGVERARRFLHSLCYSMRGGQDVIGGGPPRVGFTWPTLYDITCRIRSVEVTMTKFNLKMQPVQATAVIQLAEALSARIYHEDVLQNGTIRR